MKTTVCVFALVVAAVLLLPAVCPAQGRLIDVVIMKDGSVIKGTIQQLNTRQVRITTLEGEEVVKPFEQVLTFQQELFDPEAEAAQPAKAREESPFFDRHTWEVGLETYSATYKEPGLMEQTGLMAGVHVAYAYHNGWMLKGELGIGAGELDYSSNGTGSDANVENAVLETRALVGYDFVFSEVSALTLYFGFGYRYLNDDSAGRRTTTGALGYEREANYYYSPIGIETVHRLSEKWRLSVTAEYDLFWMGRQETYLSDVDPRYSDLTNDQNSGLGLRASVGAARDYGWGMLIIEPFVRYWDIGDSEITNITFAGTVVGTGLEPANKTTEVGLSISLSF